MGKRRRKRRMKCEKGCYFLCVGGVHGKVMKK
jgi:hypothetical protein